MSEDPAKWKWWERRTPYAIFFILLFALLLVGIFMPAIPRAPRGVDRMDAISNAKQIFYLLFDFKDEFGSYPNESTVKEVAAIKPEYASGLGGESSNDFFRQFFASDYTTSEEIFYARTANSHHPDGVVGPNEAIAKGECGFAYVVWDGSKEITGSAPLLITPLIPGELKFDYALAKKRYGRTAVILSANGSVNHFEVNRKGRVMIDGKDFFDWSQPHWDGQKPRIVWPE